MNDTVSVMISGPGISIEENVSIHDPAALDALRKLLNNNLRHLAAKAKREKEVAS